MAENPPAPLQRGAYYYRRPLRLRELVPALGIGVGVGLAAFYVARLLIARTPLLPEQPGAAATRARPPVRARP